MNKGVSGIILAIVLIGFFIPYFCEASDRAIGKDLQGDLQRSKTIIEQILEKLKTGESAAKELKQLQTLSENIKASHLLLQERFRLREEAIMEMGSKARERHGAMEEGYRKALWEYLNLIESLQLQTPLTPETLQTLKTLLDSLLPKKNRPIHGSLPYRNLHYPSIQPSQTQPIVPAYKGGNKTLSAEDLESTKETPITEEIANLAQSLNWNPVSIYEYLKNNIETQWYWGCMKGAEETLHQRSGNDCDQAALFASLLRASGFPTRYVRGTMEFFAGGKSIVLDKVKNLTGIDDPWKMAEFFQKAGIPYNPVITGGKISNFQIEHIWIESEIPYGNYRGAIIDESEKTWLGLDTSIKIKGYTYNAPQDLFEQSAFISQLPAMRNEYLSAMQTQTPLEYLDNVVLETTGLTAESYKLTHSLIPDIMNILPASMQFEQRRITNEYTEIPDELKHKVRFVAADPRSPSPEPLFDLQLSTFQLSNKRIALSYEPETVEDQQIIDSYGGLDNTPAYLVRLRPVLKVDGERIIVGKDGLPMGSDYNLTIELVSPNGTEKITNTHITGNLAVIGITAQKTVGAPLAAPSEDDDAEIILFKEANRYIDRWNQAEEDLASLLHLNITRPIPTVVTVGGVIDVTYLLDMPHGFEWKGVFVDAGLRAIGVTPSRSPLTQGEDENRQKTFMQLSALQGSILENRIFEDDFKVDSISTAKLFEIVGDKQSASSGQLMTIDKTNINTLIPTLDLDDNIKEDITNAVNQGLVVRIPSADSLPLTAVSYADWTGIGYIKENLATGEAGYMLSGMIAGGMTAVSPQQVAVWRSAEYAG